MIDIITNILTCILILLFVYFMDQTMFYRMEKKICKTYGGNCKLCCCWSCKKKEIENEKSKMIFKKRNKLCKAKKRHIM